MCIKKHHFVSILILVDVLSEELKSLIKSLIPSSFNPYSGGCAFRSISYNKLSFLYSSFNPYSGGCAFRSVFVIHILTLQRIVSILILVDVLSEVYHLSSLIPAMNVSILILVDVLSEENPQLLHFTIPFCFNPYSGGCAFRSPSARVNPKKATWFQSLFWWMCFQKLNFQYCRIVNSCFNPYSGGCAFRSRYSLYNTYFQYHKQKSPSYILFVSICQRTIIY